MLKNTSQKLFTFPAIECLLNNGEEASDSGYNQGSDSYTFGAKLQMASFKRNQRLGAWRSQAGEEEGEKRKCMITRDN